MNRTAWNLLLCAALASPAGLFGQAPDKAGIQAITPPERDFFSKRLDFHGILIKAHAVVADEALLEARNRMAMMLKHLPAVRDNLGAARAEVHIIGRKQVTTDLPEWQVDKHVPLDEYDGLTRDERTRGMGGLITSCGEENLLRLPKEQDHYFGRDICVHEFAHNIHGVGMDEALQARVRELAAKAKGKGLWLDSYAGSNEFEFFAELSMWYFGGHGDLRIRGPKPADGPEGLKRYDPESFAFLDDFYRGRLPVRKPATEPGPEDRGDWVPRDSQVARGIVKKLTAYRAGATTLEAFRSDAGLKADGDEGRDGWHVERPKAEHPGESRFQVFFQDPKHRTHKLATLTFKGGLLTAFAWDN